MRGIRIDGVGFEVILCAGVFELCCGDGVVQNRVERRFEQEQGSCGMPDCGWSGGV